MLPIVDDEEEERVQPVCVFVTRAYIQPDGKTYRPKVRSGIYECQRGMHRLHGMTEDFETFEVLVNGHRGILLGHWGSWGSDSDGCFCLGKRIIRTGEDRDGVDGPDEMVTESRATFAEYMKGREGIDKFSVIVEERFPSDQ